MQQDKACRCVTSRMFPHRESKCSLRTNPASSLRTIVNQTSSGISSLVSSPDSRASVPLSPAYVSPEATKSEAVEKSTDNEQATSSPNFTNHKIDDEDDGLAEALLAIAMLESSPSNHSVDKSNSIQDNLLDFTPAPEALEAETQAFDVLPTIPEEHLGHQTLLELDIDYVPPRDGDQLSPDGPDAAQDKSVELPFTTEDNTPLTPLTSMVPPTAEAYHPTYAQPCNADELASIQAAQALHEALNGTDIESTNDYTPISTKPTTSKTDSTFKDGPCKCVSSTLFPHRISKCSLLRMTGQVNSNNSASSSSSSTSNPSNPGGLVSAKAQLVGDEEVPVGRAVSPHTESDSEQNQHDSTTNAGSRPCRCVSAVMFPHRANKCTLLNTNKAVSAAISGGAAHGVAGAGSGAGSGSGSGSVKGSSKGSKKTVARAVVLTDEQVAQNLKYRQELANTPHHTLIHSLMHMTGANILYLGAVCAVFIGGFGIVDAVIRLFFRVLRAALWR